MKAVNNNGTITIYSSVPRSFISSTGTHFNAHQMTDEQLREAGLFDLVIDSDYDERIHDLGTVYFDTENTVFRKDIINKTFSHTLSELKERRIKHFKSIIGDKLKKTDWYITRRADDGTEVPEDITTQRATLRTQTDTVEGEINALSTKVAVMTYDFPNID